MGNCQAIDNASLVIQHPGGRSEMLYWPISANEVMKLNPGHCVALLLTTTLYSSPTPTPTPTITSTNTSNNNNINNHPLRVTRIKLLRPTDMLTLGHAYRLITTQEVMKGLWEKKHGKTRKKLVESKSKSESESESESGGGKMITRERNSDSRSGSDLQLQLQVKKQEKQRPSSASRGWHPKLNSISEASS